MGLSSGALTFFRLRFDEKVKLSISEITNILQDWSFDEIYNDENLTNYGFVPLGFPEENDFNTSEIIYADNYIFAMRLDETKVNKKYFEIEFADKKKNFLKETGKNNLSKKDAEFIKNSLLLNMSKRTLPTTSLVEIIFKPEKNEIFVSSLSTKIFDALEHLFKAGFNISIYKDSLFETGKRTVNNPMFLDDLLKTTPTEF
jgi:DNA recombination-dependent growth factor C